MVERDWADGGQGFEGKQADQSGGEGQLALSWVEIVDDKVLYEYAVLVTSLDEEVLSLTQLYRDRADCENVFE